MRRDEGSALPLIIGATALLLGLTLTLSEVLSLRLAQDRTKADANFAVLYVLKQLQEVPPVVGLDYSEVVVGQVPEAISLRVASDDGRTLKARICEGWESPLALHNSAQVCDEASARLIG